MILAQICDLIYEPYVSICEPYEGMKMCGGRYMAWRRIQKGELQMNGGKMLEERELRMKGDKRWNIYHVLPPILTLLFVML